MLAVDQIRADKNGEEMPAGSPEMVAASGRMPERSRGSASRETAPESVFGLSRCLRQTGRGPPQWWRYD